MTSAENDVVERLGQLADYQDGRQCYGTAETMRNAAAEIVRLRGEVEAATTALGEYVAHTYPSIAPAEAKGDACLACGGSGEVETQMKINDCENDTTMVGCDACAGTGATPQPAGGDAVPTGAVWIMPVATDPPQNSNLLRMAWGASALSTGELANAYDSIVSAAQRCGQVITTPPDAQVHLVNSDGACNCTDGRCGTTNAQVQQEAVAVVDGFSLGLPTLEWSLATPLTIGAKLYTHPTGDALGAVRAALERFVADAVETDVRGGDVVITTCESLELARAALRQSAGEGKGVGRG